MFEWALIREISELKRYKVDKIITDEINELEENKMELENIKKANLKLAKERYDSMIANAETMYAQKKLEEAHDAVDRLDREIKVRTEAKKPYLEIIAKFK